MDGDRPIALSRPLSECNSTVYGSSMQGRTSTSVCAALQGVRICLPCCTSNRIRDLVCFVLFSLPRRITNGQLGVVVCPCLLSIIQRPYWRNT